MSEPLVELTRSPLSVDRVMDRVRHPGAGAVCVFLGTVRDHSEGRPVVTLEYAAYDSMAVAEMTTIVGQIAEEVPGTRLAVAHRTGRLVVGDVAVVCAASAAHRDEAYRACRLLIDRIKQQVPIWKREEGPDGSHWVGWQDARCDEAGHHHEGP